MFNSLNPCTMSLLLLMLSIFKTLTCVLSDPSFVRPSLCAIHTDRLSFVMELRIKCDTFLEAFSNSRGGRFRLIIKERLSLTIISIHLYSRRLFPMAIWVVVIPFLNTRIFRSAASRMISLWFEMNRYAFFLSSISKPLLVSPSEVLSTTQSTRSEIKVPCNCSTVRIMLSCDFNQSTFCRSLYIYIITSSKTGSLIRSSIFSLTSSSLYGLISSKLYSILTNFGAKKLIRDQIFNLI